MAVTNVQLSLDSSNMTFFPDSEGTTNVFDGGNVNKPKLIHIENAMPTSRGYRSLNTKPYITTAPTFTPLPFQSRRLLFIRSITSEPAWYFAVFSGSVRHHQVFDIVADSWSIPFTIAFTDITYLVTQAFVNGVSYLFTHRDELFSFTDTFAGKHTFAVQGLTLSTVEGITSALNYLIAFDADTIFWSAPNNALDFRPVVSTIITGAGQAQLQDLDGVIVKCFPLSGGFLIYTTEEVIAARYSGNSLNPWVFSKVRGSGGIIQHQEVIGIGSSAASHFVYTKSGLQEINLTQATQIIPNLTDYLASMWSTVSDNDGTFTVSEVSNNVIGKIIYVTYVSNRYLCVSYCNTDFGSPTTYQGVWVFDVLLKQFGHIVRDHIGTFDYRIPPPGVPPFGFQPDDTDDRVGMMGLWLTDGKVDQYRLSPEGRNTTGDTPVTGELIFSEYKLTTDRMCSINQVKINGDQQAQYTSTVGVHTRDEEGIRASEVSFTRDPATGNRYVGDTTGVSHVVRISGNFDTGSMDTLTVQRGRL